MKISESNPEDTRRDRYPAPGRYQAKVKSVDDDYAEHPQSILIELEVLAGTVAGQEGRTMIERFPHDPKDEPVSDWFLRFVWAVGLIGDDEEREIEPRDAIGRRLVVELVDGSGKDEPGNERKVRIDPTGGMWPLNHVEARDVPTVRDDD